MSDKTELLKTIEAVTRLFLVSDPDRNPEALQEMEDLLRDTIESIPPGSVREATTAMFTRYRAALDYILESYAPWAIPYSRDPKAHYTNLLWMCETALENIETFPIDKLNRWLGFVQGVMITNGHLTVDEERDFSRPLFHAAYEAEGLGIPPTQEK